MSTEDVEILAARVALGTVSPNAVIQTATNALLEGADTPSLRVLAGLCGSETEDVIPLFRKALHEMGLEVPSRQHAVISFAQSTARRISSGELDPGEGAKQIWELTLEEPEGGTHRLDPFVYAASEWDDRPEDRDVLSEMIVSAAEDLSSVRLGSRTDLGNSHM